MKYKILPYTYYQAKKHNVTVKPSKNPQKKIDVFKNKIRIASVGAIGYDDYPTFWKKYGKTFADYKRNLYRKRHKRDLKSGNGFWANVLLW